MIICPKCGTQVGKNICLCPNCGEEMLYNRDKNCSSRKRLFDREKTYSAIAYIGFFGVIPLLRSRNTVTTMFHINQGLCLFIAEVVYNIFYLVLKGLLLEISIWLSPIIAVVGVARILFVVFSIIGIIGAIKGEKRELPLVGGIQIIKRYSYIRTKN